MFDLQIDDVVGIIGKKGYKRIAIQLPEGLKEKGITIAKQIKSKVETEIFLLGDPCYGACDPADKEAKSMGCDALFHFGHTAIIKNPAVPIHYIYVKVKIDPIPILARNVEKLPKKIGLLTTTQHLHILDDISRFLQQKGKDVIIGEGTGRVKNKGQVLGCSFSAAKSIKEEVDAYLYIGTGGFHPLGVALSTGKQTFALDLEKNELRDIEAEKEPILRRRFAQIARSRDAKEFGVIIGIKEGQMRTGFAKKLVKLLEKKGKTGHLLALRDITPEALLPFRGLDAFVNTACPRVTIDEAKRYKKPILTPFELEILLGEKEWVDYEMDEII